MRLAYYLAAGALTAASMGALAQGWSPQKNIEIVAGSAPGGSNDNTARTMRRMSEAQEWKADLEKNHWTEHFTTGAALHKELEQYYSWLRTTLVDLGMAK